jgi:Family of unknown function (DUF6326)
VSSVTPGTRALEDVTVPVKLKLAALWTATMFLFAYGDLFTLYRADKAREILGGEVAGIEVTEAFLMAVSVYVAIPSVMVFLSLALRPGASRWTNLAAGAVYALTIIASAIGEGWAHSIFLSVLEVTLVLLIVWFAWNWPRGPAMRETRTER